MLKCLRSNEEFFKKLLKDAVFNQVLRIFHNYFVIIDSVKIMRHENRQ